MVYGFVLVIHVLIALFLIAVILLQGGRGGLGEALGGSAAQSLFGGGANTVMTKVTAVSAALFMVTCLSLAALSTAQGKSVIEQFPTTTPEALPSSVLPHPSEKSAQAGPHAVPPAVTPKADKPQPTRPAAPPPPPVSPTTSPPATTAQ